MKIIKKEKQLANKKSYSHYYITDTEGNIAYTNGHILFVEDTFDYHEDRKHWTLHQITKNPRSVNLISYPNIVNIILEVQQAVEIGRISFDEMIKGISRHTFRQTENATLLLLPDKRFIIADEQAYTNTLENGSCIVRGEHGSALAEPLRIPLFLTEYMDPENSILWRYANKNPIVTSHYENKNRFFTIYIAPMEVEERSMNPEISEYIKEQ